MLSVALDHRFVGRIEAGATGTASAPADTGERDVGEMLEERGLGDLS